MTTVDLKGARERWVRTGGVELCVAELGDAGRPTVLLVHGYPDSKEVWSEVATRLAERFHVVLYDVRGHGRSTAPKPLRGGFTLEKLTDDFLAVADAVSPDAPVHLVGHDWGSVQAWEFVTVQRTQGRIASFTSMSGPSLDHFGHWIKKRLSRPTPRRAAQLINQGAKSWYVYMLHTPVLPELAWRGPLGRRWPKILQRVEKVPADGYPTPSLPTDAAHGAWLYRDNVRARLRRPRPDAYAHVPVQLITPAGDAFLSQRLYDDLEQWAPDLTRRTLPAKHWVPRTRPDQLTAWITDFVTTHEDGVPPVASAASAPGKHADRFSGQLVLVTGAGSGIGRATAFAFAEAGARVVAVDRDAESAARTAEMSRLDGAPAAWAETVDVSDEQAMEKLAEKVATEYGVVDVLVNNAGIGLSGSFLDTSAEDWKKVLDVNLWGVIHGCRLFGKQMAERGQGGHIVNTASAAAYQPSRALPAYSTSKAAVLMLSECLRAELAGQGIGVSAICPGFVNTNITATARFAGVSADEEARRQKKSARLYGLRNYPPEKVADAVLRAVVRNQAVVPVTPEARGAHLMSRFAPRALRALARLEPPL
ncbi:SDR family oxidoreductase [Streptomyces spectabilis]|uniref:NAD(P)-dependent dehydrogenase (Short-subunit alcohol dehydrogenase family)/pimeloyl-ACP methyl ester carboxylesterase n=1 Tax=Streptomyces spectabilis TaxID=68270 RepID=A0A5P2X8Z0_STRST|nr:SDR family oxidoreductase [Streptomyces spectabilis]MBB5104014.1 NAD(P)-dependent dehydrogenase (short-subunit alcohol dehydrogenase family)/pimeloyl-ACP methyl ester carboxylesterase [Streptomyces spectabilis]MCI3903751.1 SDR family oxidoreductase [Streptomyces spectabilis]QEV60928.1 SDR family oxidoreductase [Streptomyces spectabilis]GGV40185.1 short chain dehydrogenase [Streptomyces spectabilis]